MKSPQLFDEIKALNEIPAFSKHEQLIQGIINALDQKVLVRGDILPSVNQMMKELGFARETISKAYKDLVNRGIIESKNRKGYFVSTEDTGQHLRVCLLLFAFDTFQETFYQSFKNNIGENIQVDLFFHHNNFSVFENTINNIKGKYGMYVIAPIDSPAAVPLLEQLPMNKMLIVDRRLELDSEHSYIVQEFKESSYSTFVDLIERIKEFDEFIFFFKQQSAEPNDILESFQRFVDDYGINGVVKNKYEPGSIEPNKVYFTIHNLELWEMLKDSKVKGLKPGRDLGILSHNDDNVKEIIFDGITTFSIDFAEMGERAAQFVLNRKPITHIMESKLILRNSL